MIRYFRSLLITAISLLLVSAVWADSGGSSGASKDAEPVPASIERLIESRQFDRAEAELKEFVRAEKKNADAWNLLGFSQRKNGDLDGSLASYKKALKLDKKHLGAHEYLGELYIMRGETKKAKKQLKKLAKLCGDCEQHRNLSAAIKDASS